MATKTITGKVTGPDGTNKAGAIVTATLSQPAVITGTQEVAASRVSVTTASDGTYSLTLQANNDLTPNGTFYAITESATDGGYYSFTIVVPQTAGPFVISNLQTNPPAASPTPTNIGNATFSGPDPWFDVKSPAYGAKGDGVTNDGAAIQLAVNAASTAGGGTVFFPAGTYLVNTTVTLKSNVCMYAYPRTVTLKRTVTGDVLAKTASGALDRCTILGFVVDLTNVAWSAVDVIGSDAGGQITNFTMRDCQFKNPSSTWMIQINYLIVDPTIPTLKNRNIRIEDCVDDATGQAFTLENFIIVNSQDVVIQNCRFLNAPATLGAHVGIYAYNRNVRFLNNYVENWTCTQSVYVQQSDAVQIIGDNFRNSSNTNSIVIFNSKDVSVIGGTMSMNSTASGVGVVDQPGATFDGHTNLYNASSGIRVQSVRLDGMQTGVSINVANVQGQTDLIVEDNLYTGPSFAGAQLFSTFSVPNSPSAPIRRITIRGNHVASHRGFSGGSACIEIGGNASASLGGIQTVVIEDNLIAASSGGSGCDIEVQPKADDILITGNRCLSPVATALLIGAAVTNARAYGNVGAGPLEAVVYVPQPNGSDDTSAVQAAVNSLPAGGRVYFPPGTYIIQGPITVAFTQSILFDGAGSKASILQPKAGGATALLYFNGSNYGGARRLGLVGSSGTYSSNPAYDAIQVNGGSNNNFEDLEIQNFNGWGVNLIPSGSAAAFGNNVTNVHVKNSKGGIHTQGSGAFSGWSTGTSVSNCFTENIQLNDCYFFEDNHDFLASNLQGYIGNASATGSCLHIKGICAAGYIRNVDLGALIGGAAAPTPVILIESSINGSPIQIDISGGIAITGSTGVTITAGTQIRLNGLDIYKNGTHGVVLNGTGISDVSIRNCIFSSNGFTAGAGHYDLNQLTSMSNIEVSQCNFLTVQGSASTQVANSVNPNASGNMRFSSCIFSGIVGSGAFAATPLLALNCTGYDPLGGTPNGVMSIGGIGLRQGSGSGPTVPALSSDNTNVFLDANGSVYLRPVGGGFHNGFSGDNTGFWRTQDSAGTTRNTIDDAAGNMTIKGSIAPGNPGGGLVSQAHLFSGSGVPNNSNGANGDFYFRQDTPGTANQRLYVKSAGAWVALTL